MLNRLAIGVSFFKRQLCRGVEWAKRRMFCICFSAAELLFNEPLRRIQIKKG